MFSFNNSDASIYKQLQLLKTVLLAVFAVGASRLKGPEFAT